MSKAKKKQPVSANRHQQTVKEQYHSTDISNETYHQALLQNLPVAVYTCDGLGYIKSYNDASVQLWGREPAPDKELWCGSWKTYYPDGTPLPLEECPMAIALKEGRITHPEMIIETPDGQKRHIIPYPRLLYDAAGNIEGAINTLIDITEQVETRKKIEEIEIRNRLTIEAAEMGTFDWDMQNDIFICSPKLNEIFGIKGERNASHMDLVNCIHPEDLPARNKAIEDSYSKGALVYEARIIWDDHSVHWVKVYGKIIYDKNKRAKKMYGAVLDISEEKQAEERLRKSEEQFKQIADLMPQMVWTVRPDGYMDYHNRKWYDYTGVDEGKGDENKIQILHPEDEIKCREAFTHSMKTGEIYQVEFRLKDNLTHGGYRWFLGRAVPIRDKENNIIKWLGTSTDIDDHKNFSKRLEQKVNERTRELNEKNNFIQTLLDSSVDMIIVLDKDLRFILLNKTAEDIFKQYIPEDIAGKTLEEVDPQIKEKESYTDMIACLTGEAIHRKEVKSKVADRYFDLHYVPIKNEMETYAVMLITREVTESVHTKQAMEATNAALKERNEFVETIIDASQNYIAVYDTETRLVSINLSSEKMLKGKKREEMIGKKLIEIFPEAKGTKPETDLLRAIKGEYIKNDGYVSPISQRYIQNYLTPLRNVAGKVYAVLVTAYDMTDIKKSEEEIKSINYQLTKAQHLAHIGSWEWNTVTNKITWTDELYRIFGVSPDNYENTFDNYMKAVHPEDRQYTAKIVEQAINDHTPFDFVHRIIHPSGAIHTLHAKGEIFTNNQDETILLAGTAQDITETVEMELRLRQSEIRHHLMVDQIEDYAIIFLNEQGYIEDWNKGAEKIKGYTEKEIIGKHFSIFYSKADQDENLPEKILKEARKNKKASFEGWRIRKDGSRFWASVVITALLDENKKLIGFSKLTRDRTEQKIVEEQIKSQTEKVIEQNTELEKINTELADQKAFAELLIESNPLMILSYDKDLVINTWNKKSEEYSILKKKDVLGKKMFDVFPKYNNEEWIKLNDEVLIHGKSLFFPKVKFNYQKGWGESFVIPLRNTKNEIIGLLSITKDITEVVKMNEDIERKNQDLEKVNKELASFSYIASHDLQEPLRKILTYSSRLMEKHKDKLSDESVALMNKIESSALRMKTLIQSLLEYSRLTSQESQMEPTDLNIIISDILNDFELLTEQKKAKINSTQLPVVHAIPLQMNQLFYNLLGNALKFSREDIVPVIHITARTLPEKEVKSNAALNHKMSYCEILFSDNGIGFDQKFAEKIFITFQRLNSVSDYPGTGIGLALSKKIVENHSGQIYAESAPDNGSVFHIILPLGKPKEVKKERKKKDRNE